MTKNANLDIFSSFLSLQESSDPYEDALELISRLGDVKGGSELKGLREQLRHQKMLLAELQARTAEVGEANVRFRISNRNYFQGGLEGDAKRLGSDFKKAADKLFSTVKTYNPILG